MKKFLLPIFLVFSSVISSFAAGHVATAVGMNPTCNGLCNGSATAMAAAGVGPYGFTWTGPSGYTGAGANISGLCAGTYVVTAIDSADMSTAFYTLIISQPSPIAISLPSTYSACAGGGCVALMPSVTGGTGGYTYSWSPATSLSSPTILNPMSCAPSTISYTLTVTDANLCTATASTIVIRNPVPVVTVNSPTICAGAIAVMTATGATTYSWSTGATTNPLSVSPGTTTTYTVTGASAGCVGTAVATVTVSPAIVVTLSSMPATCGACNGAAFVNAPGAIGYMWNGPGGYTSSIMNPSGLCPGTYTCSVTNGMGCTYSATTNVPFATPVVATATSIIPSTCGACNGSANIVATGGTPPYTYLWSNGQSTATATNLCAGVYTVNVTDGFGCNTVVMVTIPNTSSLMATVSVMPTDCGSCNGSGFVSASGGTPGYTYDWTPGTPTGDGTPTITNLCAGTYTVDVTDGAGCTVTNFITVGVINASTFTVTNANTNESNYGMHDGAIDLTVAGSAPPYTFLWNNGATTEDIYSLVGGTYSVTITDNNGDCGVYTFSISTLYSYGYITGYTYNDVNMNCIFDAGDNGLAGYYVSATNGTSTFSTYSNASGFYSILVPTGSYTVTPTTIAYIEGACTNSYSATVTTSGITPNNNFAYTPPPIYDVCVSTSCNGIVPGFPGHYNVYLVNYGNMPATGVLYFVKPSILTYVSSFPAASSISGDTIFWNYTLLPSYASITYVVNYATPPTAPLFTTTISYTNAAVTNGTDINPGCNYYVYTRMITGSFDPNAKTVSPAGSGPAGNISLSETEFSYLVQFQNTGSGPAVNISVLDTISPMLDLSSFQMLNASHPYIVEFLSGNVIRWTFNSIMLPDSTSDEPGSHGHVQFKISKLNAPMAGEVITNRANIYFDFNAPIVTNTAINTYPLSTGIGEATINGNVVVYPNPFTDNTTFVIQSENVNEVYSFELMDVLGKKVKSISGINEKQFTISRNGLMNGIYFYKILSENGLVGIGKVIIK